jgi:uncharacterized protein YndB with AHSA1/START domain
MTERSVVHATFTIERTYDASPARVFAAFADAGAKKQWFGGPPEWGPDEHEMDFRVGGRETNRGGPKGGPVHHFDARYMDIVPDRRIVFAYDLYVDDVKLSVSLTTIQLQPAGKGTRLTFTEQGAFLDGHEDPSLREEGTRGLLEALARALAN